MKHSFFFVLILLINTQILFATPPAASTNTTVIKKSSKYNLGEIVVTASRRNEKKIDIPFAATIINKKNIEESLFTSIADLLGDTLGFTQVYDYHSPIVLRGVSASRILFLKDGIRQIGNMPSGFMGQTVNIFDVDKIEIIRGPGSVMYGSGAMGGIINILSRNIFNKKGFHGELASAFYSNGEEKVALGKLGWAGEQLAFQINGRITDADNFTYTGGEEAINSYHKDADISTRIGYKITEKSTLMLHLDLHFGGPWGKPEEFNRKTMWVHNENDDQHQLSLTWKTKKMGILDSLAVTGFVEKQDRKYIKETYNVLRNVTEKQTVDYEAKNGGGNIVGKFFSRKHTFSFGADGYVYRIWSPQIVENYVVSSTNKSDGDQGAGISSVGIFAEDKFDISSKLNMRIGARLEYSSVTAGDAPSANLALLGGNETIKSKSALSGNAGLVRKLNRDLALSMNVARTFRIPSQSEMFSEKVTCAGSVLGNPTLEPESSWNVDIGLKGKINIFTIDVALFANFYHNLINRQSVTNIPSIDMIYDNVEKARIIGTEISISCPLKNFFSRNQDFIPGASFVAYRGDNWTDKGSFFKVWNSGDPLHQIAPPRVRLYMRYSGLIKLGKLFTEINYDWNFKNTRIASDEMVLPWSNEASESHGNINVKMGLVIPKFLGFEKVKVNISIQNILDTVYYPYGSYIMAKGRNIKFFTSFSF